MKTGTPLHPKTTALMMLLKVERPTAVGILEMTWHFTAGFARNGAIGKFSDPQIAAAVEWRGSAKRLVKAMVDSGWFDADDGHRLIVHGWVEHAPDHVHMALARAGERFADGTMPKLHRLTKPERDAALKKLAPKSTDAHCALPVRTENAPECVTLPSHPLPSQNHSNTSPIQPNAVGDAAPSGGGGSGGSEDGNEKGIGSGSGGLGRALNQVLDQVKVDPNEQMLRVQAKLSRLGVGPLKQQELMRRIDIDEQLIDWTLEDVDRDVRKGKAHSQIGTLVARLEKYNRNDRSTWPKKKRSLPRTPEERGEFPQRQVVPLPDPP